MSPFMTYLPHRPQLWGEGKERSQGNPNGGSEGRMPSLGSPRFSGGPHGKSHFSESHAQLPLSLPLSTKRRPKNEDPVENEGPLENEDLVYK